MQTLHQLLSMVTIQAHQLMELRLNPSQTDKQYGINFITARFGSYYWVRISHQKVLRLLLRAGQEQCELDGNSYRDTYLQEPGPSLYGKPLLVLFQKQSQGALRALKHCQALCARSDE